MLRKPDRDTGALPVGTGNGDTIVFAEIQTDTFVHIVQAVDIGLPGLPVADAFPHLLQPLRRHPLAVVRDQQNAILSVQFSFDPYHALATFVLDSVVQCIFHQRLQRDLGNLAMV